MTSLGAELVRFATELRRAGVRISVAETIDAVKAVAAAGLERTPMREALAASLIKDESDRGVFDQLFTAFFSSGREPAHDSRGRLGVESSAATGSGRGENDSIRPTDNPRDEPAAGKAGHKRKPREAMRIQSAEIPDLQSDSRPGHESEDEAQLGEARAREEAKPSGAETGFEAGRRAERSKIENTPFALYSDLEYEQARDALAPIARRFRVRAGRRLHAARQGRLDFRRTIRASIQRGGALADLRFRARRPRHIDLAILADISGSVRYSSTLMLELAAGARSLFRRVRSFVYIDRLAEADFEDGHLVMQPPLDLYARSDFGRVLNELWERRSELLNRTTVLVIMGDGRNNRRPARADLLREMSRLCRAVLWLIPEERERWGAGDSAIFQYAREVTALVPSRNLRELEAALARVG